MSTKNSENAAIPTSIERLTPHERAANADVLLNTICEDAWGEVSELTERLRDAGFGPNHWPTWERLSAVPVLSKASFAERQRRDPLLGGLAPRNLRPEALFMSPGGILEPDMPAAEKRLAELLGSAGMRPGDVVLNGFGYHFTPAGMLFDRALRRLGCTVLAGGGQNTELLIEYMLRTRATGFVGIGSHLKIIIEQAEAQGLEVGVHLPLRIAMVGAEPMTGGVRQMLRERYHIHSFDLYGTADVGLVAGECEHICGLHLHPEVLAEVVDPVSGDRLHAGEVGELVLTVANPDYPMLRYGTGDLATLSEEACACGRTTPRITGVVGRVGNSARVRGMLLYEHVIRRMLETFPEVQGCLVEISRDGDRDRLVGSVALVQPWAGEQIEAFKEAFKSQCRLRLDEVLELADSDAIEGVTLRDLRFSSGDDSVPSRGA